MSRFLTSVRYFIGDTYALLRRHVRGWLWAAHGHMHERVTTRTKVGLFTVMSRDQVIGRNLFCLGEFELDLISQSMTMLRSNGLHPPRGTGTVLDIGANNGVISISMLSRGEVHSCVAIEPDPINFELLEQNVSQNDLRERIICIKKAVSISRGSLDFELSEDNLGDHRIRQGTAGILSERYGESKRKIITVEAELLDDLVDSLPKELANTISLVWIDVQGFEGFALKGATRLLQRGIPVVAEIWPYGMQRAGTDQSDFCELAKRYWTRYWILRHGCFVEYPVDHLPWLFHELGDENFDNIVLTR